MRISAWLNHCNHGSFRRLCCTIWQFATDTVYSRMLAPGFGIVEDPATGGASGPLGSYLLYHGVVDAARARALLSLQGVAMKRPSRIHISIGSHDETITRVRIGGTAVMVAEGRLLV